MNRILAFLLCASTLLAQTTFKTLRVQNSAAITNATLGGTNTLAGRLDIEGSTIRDTDRISSIAIFDGSGDLNSESVDPSKLLYLNNAALNVPTVSQMRALSTTATLNDGQEVSTSGRNTATDGGGATFVWNASSTATTNMGTVFAKSTGGTGRFILKNLATADINIRWFGAVDDVSIDSTTAITNAVWEAYQLEVNNPANTQGRYRTVFFPNGKYKVTSTIPFTRVNVKSEQSAQLITTSSAVTPIVTIGDYSTDNSGTSVDNQLNSGRFILPQISSTSGTLTNTAIEMRNGQFCYLEVNDIQDVGLGLRLTSLGGGNQYNYISTARSRFYNCKIGQQLDPQTAGWVNANTFWAGYIITKSDAELQTGYYHINIDGSNSVNKPNDNKWFGTGLEYNKSEYFIRVVDGFNNHFYGVHMERGTWAVSSPQLYFSGSSTLGNTIQTGFLAPEVESWTIVETNGAHQNMLNGNRDWKFLGTGTSGDHGVVKVQNYQDNTGPAISVYRPSTLIYTNLASWTAGLSANGLVLKNETDAATGTSQPVRLGQSTFDLGGSRLWTVESYTGPRLTLGSTWNFDTGSIQMGTTGVAPAAAAISVTSTTRSILPARLTTAQKNSLASPLEGLWVQDTTLNRPAFYTGSAWKSPFWDGDTWTGPIDSDSAVFDYTTTSTNQPFVRFRNTYNSTYPPLAVWSASYDPVTSPTNWSVGLSGTGLVIKNPTNDPTSTYDLELQGRALYFGTNRVIYSTSDTSPGTIQLESNVNFTNGAVKQNGIPIAVRPTTETLAYSSTTVTVTGGKGQLQSSVLTCTNNFTLSFSSISDNDGGTIYVYPAATNCTVTLSSPAYSQSGTTLTINGGTGSTNHTVIAWKNTLVNSTNVIDVTAANYYR